MIELLGFKLGKQTWNYFTLLLHSDSIFPARNWLSLLYIRPSCTSGNNSCNQLRLNVNSTKFEESFHYIHDILCLDDVTYFKCVNYIIVL